MTGTRKVISVVVVLALFGVATGLAKDKSKARKPAAENAELKNWMDTKIIAPIVAIHGSSDPRENREEILRVAKQVSTEAAGSKFPIAKIVGAVADLVPELEGAIWRMRDIVEPSDWLHATILYRLRVTYYNDYAYGTHVKALLDFLTTPSEAKGKKFECVGQAQDWLVGIAGKIEGLLQNWPGQGVNSDYEFNFDRTLLVGRRPNIPLLDEDEKYKLFIKPYMYTLKFLLERLVMGIYYAASIDLEDFPKLVNEVAVKTGINELKGKLRFDDPVQGVTPELVFKTIRETRSLESLLTYRRDTDFGQCALKLRDRDTLVDRLGNRLREAREKIKASSGKPSSSFEYATAKSYLEKAFKYGLAAAEDQLRAYVCGIKYPLEDGNLAVSDANCESFSGSFLKEQTLLAKGADKYLFNPNSMLENFKAKHTEFQDRMKLFRENNAGRRYTLTSPVTGHSRSYNVRAFFDVSYSPRDALPYDYESNGPSIRAKLVSGEKAWVYSHGKPTLFRNAKNQRDFTMNGFFDKAHASSADTLYYDSMTELMYTKAVAPFAAFIRVPSTVRFFIGAQDIVNAN